MAKYTHYFETRITNSFESDIADFDEALDDWIKTTFSNDFVLVRQALTSCCDTTFSLIRKVEHINTTENT